MNSQQRASRPAAQRGQAMIEYVLVAALLVLALFTTDAVFDGKTGAQYLADMIRAFFRSLTYFLSLP
ncbi:hypothetical protein [Ideonella oryzae]|uniref:Flp family type IVb pilin n=1 Tax=Ideonella oryzae TaxID=2937441 RepID=A0ABT1BQS4_9BURK|nr:hypothetical protein [Ideonella oryzae]MCO5978571.1 hypothetical protein [Ideonella oryzae]